MMEIIVKSRIKFFWKINNCSLKSMLFQLQSITFHLFKEIIFLLSFILDLASNCYIISFPKENIDPRHQSFSINSHFDLCDGCYTDVGFNSRYVSANTLVPL